MLSQIGADQRCEGSSEKSWFGTANRLHCTPDPSRARFSRSRTNFIHARTTSRHGPSMGEWMGQSSLHNKVYPCRTIFFWYAYFFHLSRAKIFRQCKWGLKLVAYWNDPWYLVFTFRHWIFFSSCTCFFPFPSFPVPEMGCSPLAPPASLVVEVDIFSFIFCLQSAITCVGVPCCGN